MSRITRNLIIVLVLIPALAWGVAKLAIWYTVNDAVSNAREALSPVAKLEYANILSPVFGPFGVTGVRIQPHIFDESISIGSALVNIEDPVEKYDFIRASMRDTLPFSFNISLNDLRIPLNGEMAKWFDQQTPSDAGQNTGSPALPASCRPGAPFSARDLKAMGYEELVGHIVLDYNYDRLSGGLVVYLNLDLQDMFEVTIEGQIPSEEVIFDVSRWKGVPKLSDLSISFDDASWSERFNRYCAKALDIDEGQYVERKITEMREMLAATGFEPSDELLDGLRKFTTGAAPLTLSLNPRKPLDPTQIAAEGGDPETVIDRLGIEVMIDDHPVQNLGAVRVETPGEKEEETEPVVETFKPTPLRELALYLKSRIRVFTDDGKVHDGYLDSIDAGKLVMTRHLAGGSVTFDVERSNVKEVRVLRP